MSLSLDSKLRSHDQTPGQFTAGETRAQMTVPSCHLPTSPSTRGVQITYKPPASRLPPPSGPPGWSWRGLGQEGVKACPTVLDGAAVTNSADPRRLRQQTILF